MTFTADPVVQRRRGRRVPHGRLTIGGAASDRPVGTDLGTAEVGRPDLGGPNLGGPDLGGSAVAVTANAAGQALGHRALADQQRAGWVRRYRFRVVVADLLGLLISAQILLIAGFPAIGAGGGIDRSQWPPLVLTAALLLVWMLALTWSGSREPTTIGYGTGEFNRIIAATFAAFGVAAIASYLVKFDLPRSYLLLMMPVGLAALLVSRIGCRRWLHVKRDSGECVSRVLALGTTETVTDLLRDLRRAPRAGYRVIGVCISEYSTDSAGGLPQEIDGVPVLGGLDRVAHIARSTGADAVAVTSTASLRPSAVRELSWELESTDAKLILAPAIADIAGARIHTQPVAGLPLIHVDAPPTGARTGS